MIKFSKKIEYALGTLQYLGMFRGISFSARELSENLNIPYEFLSKTLAQLAKSDILISNFGTKGGYQLAKEPKEIRISAIFKALNEPLSVVECVSGDESICERSNICLIKTPMQQLQEKITNLIGSITLEELINLSVLKNDINNNVQQNKVKYAE